VNFIIDKNSRAFTVESGDIKLRFVEQSEGIITVENLGKLEKTEADGVIYLSDGKK